MMDERRYWYLASGILKEDDDYAPSNRGIFAEHAQKRDEETRRRRTEESRVLSIPWWIEAVKWVHEDGDERVAAPMIFTTREAAEAQLREIQDTEPDNFLSLVERHGEGLVNRAYINTAPLRVFGLDDDLLFGKLEDSDFLCVMVDGVLKLRQDFMEELRDG